MKTTDICDEYAEETQIGLPGLQDFGGRISFHGPITTLLLNDDNALVRRTFGEAGNGRVLVIDNGGSMRCAMVGDQLAALAAQNGWAGIVINGCIRDRAELAQIDIGIKALAAMPRRSAKHGAGERDRWLRFAGLIFVPGHYLYADADGIVLATRAFE